MQEVPSKVFGDSNVSFGPILRIDCYESIQFLKPVTIQLPVSPQASQESTPDASACRVRVLFLTSHDGRKDWVEITDNLINPARFDGTSVRFEVERFSG